MSFNEQHGNEVLQGWIDIVHIYKGSIFEDSLEAAVYAAAKRIVRLEKELKELKELKKKTIFSAETKSPINISNFSFSQIFKKSGLNLQEFADKLALSKSAVASWSSGRREPSDAMKEKIVRMFK